MRATSSTAALFAAASLAGLGVQSTMAASWNLTKTYMPNDFFSGFSWFTDPDPTHGLVLYQSQSAARSANLSTVRNGQFVMAVETTPVALEGRKSVRISSNDNYSDGVYVLNFAHVPTGCAVWPAFWTVTSDLGSWPKGGEIDIAENANNQFPGALSSLHTASNCNIPQTISNQTGSVQYTNCSAYTPENNGCRTQLASGSWGKALNQMGGGIYAMERSMGSTGHGVRTWFFPNGSEPADLKSGSSSVDPNNWGRPGASFDVANNCHGDFGPHKITFTMTLCGDWAANTYNTSGCNTQYPACSYQVGYNGSSFNSSYWSIYDLRVFANGGSTDNAANSPNTHASSSSAGGTSGSSSQRLSLAGSPLTLATVGAAAALVLLVSMTVA